MTHFMNKQHGAHMDGGDDKPGASKETSRESTPHESEDPQIHIHSHSKGHTVHVMHHSGAHEKHEHSKGDTEGISEHIKQHLGGQPSAGGEHNDEEEDSIAEHLGSI